jgi:hypothetical protein
MSMLVRALVVACAFAAVSATAAGARADAFSMGLYTCYEGSASVVGGLQYHGSMMLKTGGRYAFAYSVKGRTLVKPRAGAYRAAGSRITFTTGILKSFYGVRVDASRFVLHLKSNKRDFAWCYRK